MHWLFGDQLGPHFLTPGEGGPGPETPLLMIEARSVFRGADSTGPRPTWCCPRCATARPNRATACVYRPGERTGEHACPYTAGYWAFLDRHRELLAGNQRVARPVRQLDRLADLPEVLEQEHARGDTPP